MNNLVYIGINNNSGITANSYIRKAISLAVNREALVKSAYINIKLLIRNAFFVILIGACCYKINLKADSLQLENITSYESIDNAVNIGNISFAFRDLSRDSSRKISSNKKMVNMNNLVYIV